MTEAFEYGKSTPFQGLVVISEMYSVLLEGDRGR